MASRLACTRVARRGPRAAALLVAALATCLLAGPGAASAAVWGTPQAISRAHTSIYGPAFGTTSTGTGVASWQWQDGLGNGAKLGASYASRPASSSAYRAERALPAGTVAASPHAESQMIVATATDTPRTAKRTLRVRFGDLTGDFGSSKLIASDRENVFQVKLAVNGRGDAALVWAENLQRVYVSSRRHGGSFGSPVRVGSGRIRGISVAVGPSGDVLVAWDARGRVLTRWKSHTNKGFGSVDEVRSQTTYYAALQTAISSKGRAWIAWTSQLLTEGGDRGEAYIQVARRPAGASKFDRALLLDRSDNRHTPSPVSLALDPSGEAVLAWSMWGAAPSTQDTFTTVRAAHVDAHGVATVTQLARFASIGEGLATVTSAPDGSATALWTQTEDARAGTMRVLASWTADGAAWGPEELVSSGRQSSGVLVTDARGHGAPTALLGARETGGGYVLQAVTRQP